MSEMDKLFEIQTTKTQEELGNLNSFISSKEIEFK